MKTKLWLTEIITCLLGLLFLYTAASKLLDFRRFTWEINNQPFDNRLTPLFIYGLPGVELLAVILLLIHATRLKGLYLSAFLMAVFTGYVALVTFHYYPIVPCSCAGVFHLMNWPEHLVFNIVFTVMAIIAIQFHRQTTTDIRKDRYGSL